MIARRVATVNLVRSIRPNIRPAVQVAKLLGQDTGKGQPCQYPARVHQKATSDVISTSAGASSATGSGMLSGFFLN